MEILPVIISGVVSYKLCDLLTNPKSKIWNGFPRVKSKRIDFFPSVRVKIKGRVVHFHHWFNYSLLLGISVFVTGGMLDSWIVRGLLMGGVVQGLATPSARKLIYKEEWLQNMLSRLNK